MSIAVFVTVAVLSTKAIASVPMLSEVGGGHWWLVGKSPSVGVETGVHARPSFGPPLHVFVVGSQIGHGWMNVRHLAPVPGQSAVVMQPLPSFVPPTHAPVSQLAVTLQSPSEQQGAPLSVHRPVSFVHVPPPGQALVPVLQVDPPQPAPGVVPPMQRFGRRSPARKIVEPSGRLKFVTTPVEQSAVPAPLAETVLMTQVLAAAFRCAAFGSGSGGPKRQPAFVHWRKLHVPPGQSAFVVHELFWFEPPAQRLPPAWAGVVPLSVSAVPAHDTLEIEVPMSGTANGSGTATAAPPT